MKSVQQLTRKIIAFRNARNWKQFHNPKDLAISLTLEASELLEHFQWKNLEILDLKKIAAYAGLFYNNKLNDIAGEFRRFAKKELGLGAFETQKLSIKLEVDTNPPKGGRLAGTTLNKTYIFSVRHFDLPSMPATKLHACFYRKYTKGRDFYDLVWYLGRKVFPNLELLNNAVQQTEGKSPELTEAGLNRYPVT